jgi:hypothetical protein
MTSRDTLIPMSQNPRATQTRATGRIHLMVSSSVRGQEDTLNQVFATLKSYGYAVWMSHKGTLPLDPKLTAFENCLAAVEKCDVFLSIINGRYGSGVEPQKISITHREVRKAIALGKPRYFAVDHHVPVARELLKQFRFDHAGQALPLTFKRTNIIDDIRILEMYEEAIRSDVPLAARTGNWVQEYRSREELLEFLDAQFGDLERIRNMIQRENQP